MNNFNGDIKVVGAASRRRVWLSSGFAQGVVILNGLIITLTAFFAFSYFVKDMSADQYNRISDDVGQSFVENVTNLENTMRLITSVISLANIEDKGDILIEIRRSIPNLSSFDQIIWMFEETPGRWRHKVISENLSSGFVNNEYYKFSSNQDVITRFMKDGIFKNEELYIISDLEGMDYIQERAAPQTMSRSFAFVKAVKPNSTRLGIIVGVSRAANIIDQKILSENDGIVRFTIRDAVSDRRIYHMDRNSKQKSSEKTLNKDYSVFIGGSEWQVLIEFIKDKNIMLIGKVPYLILFFGIILTFVGTLFIRNNNRQSKKLSGMNSKLEQKNYELQLEAGERGRLNIALTVAERDNRAVIDAVSDVIFETDIEGNVLFLSASWHKITGFEVERSKGSNLFSVLYPDDRERQKIDFENFVKGQKQPYRSFTRVRISDGTFRAVELAISMIRRDKNEKLRVVGTITDVEERRRAERALAEAEKKYRTIVENAAGGLYQLTPEGIYLSANPAMSRILGYASSAEMLRVIKNANGSVYPDIEEREKFMSIIATQEQVFGYETQVLVKDGTKIWVRENVRLVKDDKNNILYLEGSMEDITKRKEADIALLEAKMHSDMANRAKTEFIANMSHELRTPLNAIIGFSDIMKNEVMGPLGQDMYKEYVADIHKSGEGLLKIINEILDISKIEAGECELNESEFSLDGVLQICIDLYVGRTKTKDIIVTNEAKNMPILIGEELSIKQVITNIYSNAVKYTPNGGRITLFSNIDSEGAFRLSITDTGIGMSSIEIEKALSVFGQIDNALDRSGAGIGLGLPLAQAIMGVHGGRLEIISEKSIGTTVTIIFPHNRVLKADNENTDNKVIS